MMEPIRVLIADDHPLFRDGMHGLLDSVPITEVVGEAETGDEAVRKAGELVPNVILMDIKMPGENGIAATRRILSAHPEIKILIVTMFEDDESVFAAMRAGANGYLLKDSRQEEVLRAIEAVANDEAIFSPGVARRVMNFFKGASRSDQPPAFSDLSEREQEILRLIAQGNSNAEIAAKLVLSLKTVQNHVSNILSKLQVADRVQAALRARAAGIG
jgi:DNA-binding NarL/FixJ family response regulator